MRNEDERFVKHPAFDDRSVDKRIEELSNRMLMLEEKIDRASKMLNEILRKKESHEILMPRVQQKNYGFEPEDEVD